MTNGDTTGIEAVFVTTHNWGKSARFFQALGYHLEFETDHQSGQLRIGDGPYVFVAEVPEDQPTDVRVVIAVEDAASFEVDDAIEVVTPFEPTHWGTQEMTVRDPDGRIWESAGSGRSVIVEPDSSAVRIALWRALHVQTDEAPHLIDDEIGLALAAPDDGWRDRPDMHPIGTRPYRVGIVARTRYVEDLLVDERITQYILLGAGLDTFVQRHPERAGQVTVFEVDQPGAQAWKRQRLDVLGFGVADWLQLIPVDFEARDDWWQALLDAGLDTGAKALVSSSGVSMYITKDATADTLRRLAGLAPGSVVVMTFMLPFELVDDVDRPGLEGAARGAQAAGTPWLSFYSPVEIRTLALDAGFANAETVSTEDIAGRYLEGRTDGLSAAGGEAVLVARV